MSTVNDWEEAYLRASELCAKGELTLATSYYINAVAKAPGNIDVIKGFVNAVVDLAGQAVVAGDRGAALRHLDWVDTFLRERTAHVCADDVEVLLSIRAEASTARMRLVEEGEDSDDEVSHVAALWEIAYEGALESEATGAVGSLVARLEELEAARDYGLGLGGGQKVQGTLKRIEDLQARLQIAVQAEAQLDQARALLVLAEEYDYHTAAAYCIQLAEGAVRELVVFRMQLDADRQKRIDAVLEDLKERSRAIAAASEKAASADRWSFLVERVDIELTAARRWSPSGAVTMDRDCTKQLERVQKIMMQVQRELPQLLDPTVSADAVKLIEELRDLGIKASMAQQKRYNDWAMNRIKLGLEKGAECLGVISDDEEKLGERMVEYFGDIDTRLLTMEVQRCHTEVFEYLFKELHGPKKKDDFESKGHKLKLLKDMFEKRKQEITIF